jgi:hypothetical protein
MKRSRAIVAIVIATLLLTGVSYSAADTGFIKSEDAAGSAADAAAATQDSGGGKSKGGISTQATSNHYISLEQYIGEYDITDSVSSSHTDASSVASYSDGRIIAKDEGVATVTLTMADSNIRVYHVSVYLKYPQPKTAIVYTSADGTVLTQWAESGNTDYVDGLHAVSDGGRITIHHRTTDQHDSNIMQYVETSSGKKRYLGKLVGCNGTVIKRGQKDIKRLTIW